MADALDEEQADILQLTVAAIGGVDEDENGASVYIKGDECIGTSLWVRPPPPLLLRTAHAGQIVWAT
jgi:hypothetical protein